ncbi:MAG: c-type cytochrome [Candidatus Acidiferrales bacterium]
MTEKRALAAFIKSGDQTAMSNRFLKRVAILGCLSPFAAAVVIAWMPVKMSARVVFRRQGLAQNADTGKPKTAAEAFKNVQILKEVPAEQLLPSMRYMTAALGVRCDYCHEAKRFDSDDKPTKQRARNMMKMMFAINSDNFSGRRDVTCYTCHRGAAKPVSIPALGGASVATAPASTGASPAKPLESNDAPAAPMNKTSGSLPDADEIFAKYIQAIGGTTAISKGRTRIEKGTVEGPRVGHATMETYREAPNKAFAVLHTPHGDTTEGVNGAIGWGRRPNGEVNEESGDELARSKQWAAFFPGESFKQEYERFQVRGIETLDGHETYVVLAWWPSGNEDRICFDMHSGLLLRITHQIESPLGALPLETNYDDYRDVDGLKIPFTLRVTRVDGTTTYRWQQMDANVPLDARQFEKPAAEKPAQKDSKP